MERKTTSIAALLAVGLYLGSAAVSSAQHSHSHGEAKYRPKVIGNLFTPQGRRVTQHHDHYRYVVPPAARYGAFYSYEKGYYYTPPTRRGQGQEAPRPNAMEFGASKHLVELAERIEALANELCLDLHHNYGHNSNFKEVYGEAFQLLEAAKFVHNSEHQADREAIHRTATTMDELFHHVQEEVIGLERQENRRVGPLGIEAKTEELQALIHHLMYDQGIKPNHDQEGPGNPDAAAGPDAREEAPPPRP